MLARTANIFGSPKFNCAMLIVLVASLAPLDAVAADPATAVVRHRGAAVVTYTARVVEGYVVIDAEHAPDWHTYAMDNVERAREQTGKENPDCELPTRFDLAGPAELAGEWRQSAPADLSNPKIFWYTWGFEGRATFAAPVTIAGEGPITLTINGQACNASSCSMIQNVQVTIDPSLEPSGEFDLESLTPLLRAD